MSKKYRLVPSKDFLKDVEKLPTDMKPRIEKALLELKENPHSSRNIKKLIGVGIGQYRLRVGNWRIRYDIAGDEIRLQVVKHRKDVYRNM